MTLSMSTSIVIAETSKLISSNTSQLPDLRLTLQKYMSYIVAYTIWLHLFAVILLVQSHLQMH